jgi:hypothetical protein
VNLPGVDDQRLEVLLEEAVAARLRRLHRRRATQICFHSAARWSLAAVGDDLAGRGNQLGV